MGEYMYAYSYGGQMAISDAPQESLPGLLRWVLHGLELIEQGRHFVREPQGSTCFYFLSIRFTSSWMRIGLRSSGLSAST